MNGGWVESGVESRLQLTLSSAEGRVPCNDHETALRILHAKRLDLGHPTEQHQGENVLSAPQSCSVLCHSTPQDRLSGQVQLCLSLLHDCV